MCLMPVFSLLGPLLAAIQFTEQAEEHCRGEFLLG